MQVVCTVGAKLAHTQGNATASDQLELMQFETPSSADVLRMTALYAVESVPVVGGLASLVLGLFWPLSSDVPVLPGYTLDYENIWEHMEPEVQQMVDEAILEQKLEDLQSTLAQCYSYVMHTE